MSHLPSKPKHSLMNILMDNPNHGAALLDLHEPILRGPSPFSPAERETIFTYVSNLNRCEFCRQAHTVVINRYDVPDNIISSMFQNTDLADVPEKFRPVLRYAAKITREPHNVTSGDVAAVIAAGWDETAVVHAAFVASLANFMNRLVSGLGIKADPATVKSAGEAIQASGYAAFRSMLKLPG